MKRTVLWIMRAIMIVVLLLMTISWIPWIQSGIYEEIIDDIFVLMIFSSAWAYFEAYYRKKEEEGKTRNSNS